MAGWWSKQTWLKSLGPYRVLPIFFLIGAGIELFMIKVTIFGTNFYQVALRKEAERRAKRKLTEDIHFQHLREELDRRIKEKKESKI